MVGAHCAVVLSYSAAAEELTLFEQATTFELIDSFVNELLLAHYTENKATNQANSKEKTS
jgi:hypothetical protein